jgi:hypothetical protein
MKDFKVMSGYIDLSPILERLARHFQIPATTEDVTAYLWQFGKTPTVASRQTGEEVEMPHRRKGCRLTFHSDLVEDLSEVLTPHLRKLFQGKGWRGRLEVESSHGDLIGYRSGDFFEWHRDTQPPGRDGQFFSLLLGLADTEEGGGTQIVDPKTRIHQYQESSRQGEWLIFDSSLMHRGMPVLKGEKVCLKLDFWLTPVKASRRQKKMKKLFDQRNPAIALFFKPPPSLPLPPLPPPPPPPPPRPPSPPPNYYHWSDEDDGWCNDAPRGWVTPRRGSDC